MNSFPWKLARSLTGKEQLNVPTYYAIKVVIIGCIVGNPPVMSVFISSLWSIEMVSYFCYCCFCLNELFSVLLEICVQRTLMNNYSWYCVFALYCIVLYFNVSFPNALHFSYLCSVNKTKLPLSLLNCHTIFIESVCRLLCKSMLPTMFIKVCVKLKHIHLASCGSREIYLKGK